MSKRFKNIRKISKIPKFCNERYLNLTGNSGEKLLRYGINFSGVSNLCPGYQIGIPSPHHRHMVIFTKGGKGYFFTEDLEWVLEKGTVLVLPVGPGCEFGVLGDGWDIIWFYLSDTPAWQFLKDGGIIYENTSLTMRLELAMEGFLLENQECVFTKAAEHYSELIIDYLNHCLRRKTAANEDDTFIRLEHIWRQVRNHLEEPWDVAKLARMMNTSPSTLQRAVKKFYGTTPWQLVVKLRIEQARLLLQNSDYPLKVIAARLGYADEFVFSNAFRQHQGISPRKFRRIGDGSEVKGGKAL